MKEKANAKKKVWKGKGMKNRTEDKSKANLFACQRCVEKTPGGKARENPLGKKQKT
jgi:hypothetical protein